jgi:hypothetical protein
VGPPLSLNVGQDMDNMKQAFIISIIILFFSSLTYSYEPPNDHPKEALEKCQIAFIGRITEIKEISHDDYVSEAIATIKIERVLIGLDGYEDNEIHLKYSSRYFCEVPDHGFPPQFSISQVYLFVINRPLQKGPIPLLFNPSFVNTIDLAYEFSDDPGFSLDDMERPQTLRSVYSNQVFKTLKLRNIVE